MKIWDDSTLIDYGDDFEELLESNRGSPYSTSSLKEQREIRLEEKLDKLISILDRSTIGGDGSTS